MFRRNGLIGMIGLFVLTSSSVAQTTWWVDDDAPGDPGPGDPTISDPLEDGSAAHPFDAVQEAIDASANGDTVLIRDGAYAGAGNYNLVPAGRAITIVGRRNQCKKCAPPRNSA